MERLSSSSPHQFIHHQETADRGLGCIGLFPGPVGRKLFREIFICGLVCVLQNQERDDIFRYRNNATQETRTGKRQMNKFEAIKSEAEKIETTTNLGQAMFFAKLTEAWVAYNELVEACPGMIAECRHRAQKHFGLHLQEITG